MQVLAPQLQKASGTIPFPYHRRHQWPDLSQDPRYLSFVLPLALHALEDTHCAGNVSSRRRFVKVLCNNCKTGVFLPTCETTALQLHRIYQNDDDN